MTRPARPPGLALRALALAAAALVATAAVVRRGVTAAHAQESRASRVRLVDQTYWRTGGSPFELVLDVHGSAPVEDTELAAVVYPRLQNRSQLTATIDGRNQRNAFRVYATALSDLPTDASGFTRFDIDPDLAADGVYPVRVELREKGGGNVLASLVTHLVQVSPPASGEPLRTAVIVPIAAPPSPPAGAAAPVEADGLDAARASAIAGLAAALADHAVVPVTLAPVPETLDALAADRTTGQATLERLREAASGRQVLASGYVPASVAALLAADLPGEIAAQLARGADVLRTTIGAVVDPATRVVGERIDDAVMSELLAEHASRLVLPEALLTPSALDKTLTSQVRLALKRDDVPVAVADGPLAAHFDHAGGDPVLAAHQALADLAQIYLDSPGGAGRGVVAMPSPGWVPSGPFLDTLLTGLADSPVLRAVTLDEFFTSVDTLSSRGRPVRRSFRTDVAAPTAVSATAVRAARRRIDAFASAAPSQAALVDRLDRAVLASESSDLRPRDRASYLDAVTDTVNGQLRGIVLPRTRSITLTAREGEIPITITSSLPYPVRTVLFLESDTLRFPKGARFELVLQRRNTTTRLAVLARSSGSFPVRLRLESPEGGVVLQESRMTVRSTALSGVGVGLSFGAAVFLLLWWAVHLRRARRDPA